jgi:uncharacterized protein YjbI with pentapeptide repeats
MRIFYQKLALSFLLLVLLACGGNGIYVSDKDLSEEDLSGKDFSYSNLQNTQLVGKLFHRSNFLGARLQGANFNRCGCTYVHFQSLLDQASFIDADLTGSEFVGARLTEVNFTRAILHNVDFTDATLEGSVLDFADLQGSRITEAQLAVVASKRCVILPDGTLFNPDKQCPAVAPPPRSPTVPGATKE